MNEDKQYYSKKERKWLEEAESDVPVEDLALARDEEPDNRMVSFGKKIKGGADTINLFVISFLAFLIALFLTIISVSEESPMLLALALTFYLIGFVYIVSWFKRFKIKE